MEKFIFYNPTKIYFGEGAIQYLPNELSNYGKNILLLYGGGSIMKNGIFKEVSAALAVADKNVFELGGVTPNPRTDIVYEGIEICKTKKIDLILAVGGGSTIDCAKAIAIGAKTDKDFWETFYVGSERPKLALPIASVLTLAGTGSEMNVGSVISNLPLNLKRDTGAECMRPKFSILDPTYTYSLPKNQLISGCVDIFSHLCEIYFSTPNTPNVSDDICEALMKNLLVNLPVAITNPDDYEARSNIMWDATLALNGITQLGKRQDWQVHQIEHQVSAYSDITHGVGLAIITPSYFRYTYKNSLKKYARFAKNIWNVDGADKTDDQIAIEGIDKFEKFLYDLNLPMTLSIAGVDISNIDKIAETTLITGGGYKTLDIQDIKNILNMCK